MSFVYEESATPQLLRARILSYSQEEGLEPPVRVSSESSTRGESQHRSLRRTTCTNEAPRVSQVWYGLAYVHEQTKIIYSCIESPSNFQKTKTTHLKIRKKEP